jgi:guanine deaminase
MFPFSLFKHREHPKFVQKHLTKTKGLYSEEIISLLIKLAEENAKAGNGPFAAIIVNERGDLIDYGLNQVISKKDSTAHAEITAIRKCQTRLGSHDLSKWNLTLYTSSDPCIQCFGAIYWSGIKKVYSCVPKERVEYFGFDEGPVSAQLWEYARNSKGIEFYPKTRFDKKSLAPLEYYKKHHNTY